MGNHQTIKLSLNGGTVRKAPLDTQIHAAAAVGFAGFGLWMESVEAYWNRWGSLEHPQELLAENGLHVTEACFLADWQNLTGAAFAEFLIKAERFMARAAQLKCDVVVVSAPEEAVDWAVSPANLRRLCELASGMGLRVALEFLPWGEVRDVATAWRMLELADHPAGGMLVDSFHFYLGGSREEDLLAVPRDRIFLVHLDDVPRMDADVISLCRKYRVYPGEGILPLHRFAELLREIGYDGFVSVELLSEEYWQQDPLTVARKAYETAMNVLKSVS